jgi:hypothetical protein
MAIQKVDMKANYRAVGAPAKESGQGVDRAAKRSGGGMPRQRSSPHLPGRHARVPQCVHMSVSDSKSTRIESKAFCCCSSLKSITIHRHAEFPCSCCFRGCESVSVTPSKSVLPGFRPTSLCPEMVRGIRMDLRPPALRNLSGTREMQESGKRRASLAHGASLTPRDCSCRCQPARLPKGRKPIQNQMPRAFRVQIDWELMMV